MYDSVKFIFYFIYKCQKYKEMQTKENASKSSNIKQCSKNRLNHRLEKREMVKGQKVEPESNWRFLKN